MNRVSQESWLVGHRLKLVKTRTRKYATQPDLYSFRQSAAWLHEEMYSTFADVASWIDALEVQV